MAKSHIKTLGSSNHTEEARESNDYYATYPEDFNIFLDKIKKDGIILSQRIWEPACGQGHISTALYNRGYDVYSSDLIDRGYGEELDYLSSSKASWKGDIITNPPFKLSSEFIFKSMDILDDGGYLMLLLPLRYLETKARYRLFQRYMPRYVYAYSYRINIGKSGVFEGGNAVAYAWFVWEKGSEKETVIRFIPSPKWKEE